MIEEMLGNYNNDLAEIKIKEHKIAELELEEVSINGSNFAINRRYKTKADIRTPIPKIE